jgi:hypothetical protein
MKPRIAVVALVVLMLLAASSSVWACKGKKVLFEDNFATLDPAWGTPSANLSAKNGKLILQLGGVTMFSVINQAHRFEDMDACVKVRLAKSDNPKTPGGLIFWARDSNNYYHLLVSGAGTFSVDRKVGVRWDTVVWLRDEAAVKKDIGEVNHLRVVTKGNQATLYINDKEVVSFKGEPPQGGSSVGIVGESWEESQSVWEFSDLKITN